MLDLLRFVWTHPLNRGGRLKALGRALRWQIACRLLGAPIALPFVDGLSLLIEPGMTGATGNWYCGLHEPDDMAFVLHLLRPGDRFLDVGANVGSYTLLAAATGALVTAVEPIPATFKKLRRNVLFNLLDQQVNVLACGLSDSAGALRFTSALDTENHVLAADEFADFVEVPTTRLDDIAKSSVPLLIKIDVEGHEQAVLSGGADTLSDPRLLAVIMETNGSGSRYGHDDSQLMKIMLGHGFQPRAYDALTRRLSDHPGRGGNTIFVRDHDAVQARLKAARQFRLVNRRL